jgi:hypothetical protein
MVHHFACKQQQIKAIGARAPGQVSIGYSSK